MALKYLLPARLNRRVLVVALHDIVMAAVSFQAALWFRYWLADWEWTPLQAWEGMVVFTGVAAIVFRYSGLYRGIWHFASMRDMLAILRASLLSLLIFLPLLFLGTRLEAYPRSALILQFFILVALLAGSRLLYRSWKDGSLTEVLTAGTDRRVPVLLVGSGLAADAFIREMERNRQAGYRVVGIIDNSEGRQGRDLRGIRVVGGIGDVPDIVRNLHDHNRPRRIIVADERLPGTGIRQLLDLAAPLGLTVSRLPRMTEFRKEGEMAQQPRPIDVEDLLGRAQRVLDRAPVVRLIAGRRVLVTGAGGTIGAELVRQIADLDPALLVLFEQSEHALYQIDMEMAERFPSVQRAAVLADIRAPERIDQVFRDYRPEIVLHAAAYKHVPLVEGNMEEGVLTNVIGTRHLAEACRRHGVNAMVLISTDKAVNPTNVMGASKRVAEMICQSFDLAASRAGAQDGTRFVTVRFGNVLGSSGSVVPLFQRQLSAGGPLTVTHPEVTRFFMTTREAVELILQAAALPKAELDTAGKIFVLDMGEPVRIRDLAYQMIRLAGLKPDQDIKVVFTGLRPGEKLYEEVLHRDEAMMPTSQDGILLAAPRVVDRGELEASLELLLRAARERDTAAVLTQLQLLVPEFRHAPQGQDRLMDAEAAEIRAPATAAE